MKYTETHFRIFMEKNDFTLTKTYTLAKRDITFQNYLVL